MFQMVLYNILTYYCARANRVFIKLNNLIQLVSFSLSLSLSLSITILSIYIFGFFSLWRNIYVFFIRIPRSEQIRRSIVSLLWLQLIRIHFEFFNMELLDDLVYDYSREHTTRVRSTTGAGF